MSAVVKAGVFGTWLDKHSAHGKGTYFEVKIGAYFIHRCSCGSRFFVSESEHDKGRAAAGQEKE